MSDFEGWCRQMERFFWLDDRLTGFKVLKPVNLPFKAGQCQDHLYGETYHI